MNTFKFTPFPNLEISIQKRFNMKKEWEMMASPSLILFSSRLAPFLGDKLEWKHVICRIQHRDNKMQCNGLSECTAAMWSYFWCQEERGSGRGARSEAGAGAQLQGFTTAVSSSWQGRPWHLPPLPFVPWFLCDKSAHAGQERARKHSCHILVRPKNCRLHCSTDLYSLGCAVAPIFHSDPGKALI